MRLHVVKFHTLYGYGRGVDVAAEFGSVRCVPENNAIISDRQLEALKKTRIHFTILSEDPVPAKRRKRRRRKRK